MYDQGLTYVKHIVFCIFIIFFYYENKNFNKISKTYECMIFDMLGTYVG